MENVDAGEEVEVENETGVENEAETEATDQVEAEAETDSSDSSTETDDSVQKRIDELIFRQRQAERDAQYWKEQAQKEPEPKEPVVVKTLEDFEYDEGKYQAYLFQEANKSAVQEAQRVLREEQERLNHERKYSSFQSKEDQYSKDVEDYYQVTRNSNVPITQQVVDVTADMDNGPAVLYYLAKNPSIADSISRMSPLATARELGRIEAKLESEIKSEKVSKAPPPAPKVSAVSPSLNARADSPESDNLSTSEWLKRRNKQLAKRG